MDVCTLEVHNSISYDLKKSDLIEIRGGLFVVLSATGQMAIRYVLFKELDPNGPLNREIGNRVANLITSMFLPTNIPADVNHLIGILRNPTWSDEDGFPCRLVMQHPCLWRAVEVIGCFHGLITMLARIPRLEKKLLATMFVPASCFPVDRGLGWKEIVTSNLAFQSLNLSYAFKNTSARRKYIEHQQLRALRRTYNLTDEQIRCNEKTWEVFHFIRWLFAHLHEDTSETSKRTSISLSEEIYVAVRVLFPAFIPEYIYACFRHGSGEITTAIFDMVVR